MPVSRQLVASGGDARVERVSAASAGHDWGPVHTAQGWRLVLPGQGQVDWRNDRERVFVDALTAFRLDAGESYQLRHEHAREHMVLCSGTQQAAVATARAWLLHPRDLLCLRAAFARLRRGDLAVEAAALAARRALERAFPLRDAEPPAALLRARQCLASHVHERMHVEELAAQARCSPFHLSRLSRQHLGIPPHQYRLHLRLALAIRQLEDRHADLADIAFGLGFSTQSHFGEVFRRAVGCTPGEARIALR